MVIFLLILKIWLWIGFLGYVFLDGMNFLGESFKGVSFNEYWMKKSLLDIITLCAIILLGLISFILIIRFLISDYKKLFKEIWSIIYTFLKKPFKDYKP